MLPTDANQRAVLLPANAVVAAGFAKFNGGEHLCVELPDDHFTISLRTPRGKLVTFAYIPLETLVPEAPGALDCIDIQHHTAVTFEMNGEHRCPHQDLILFTPGGNAYSSRQAVVDGKKPPTLTTLQLT